MFQAVMRRAQGLIESSVEKVVGKIIMAVPFLIAFGFGAAALSVRLNREFGAEIGNLLMAALFCGIGLIIGGIIAAHATAKADSVKAQPGEANGVSSETSQHQDSVVLEQVEAGVMTSLAATLLPAVLPPLLKLAGRNLPLLAVISAV